MEWSQVVGEGAELFIFSQAVLKEASDAVVDYCILEVLMLAHAVINIAYRAAEIYRFVRRGAAEFALPQDVDVCLRLEFWEVVDVAETVELAVEQDRAWHILVEVTRSTAERVAAGIEESQEWQGSSRGQCFEI